MFRSNRNQLSRTKKTKKSSKIPDNVIDSLDSTIKDSDKPSKRSKPSEQGLAPGDRFIICVKELDIENIYDNIKYLEIKLNNYNLTVAEYKKTSDDIDN